MSIRYPVPKEHMGTLYTHYGWAYGFIPVYVGGLEEGDETLLVSVRNWVPEWALDFAEAAFNCFSRLAKQELDPRVLITSEIGAAK